MIEPYKVIRDFELALADYTGAPYVTCVNSCTMALRLCLDYKKKTSKLLSAHELHEFEIGIPKRTYVSVPIQIKQAGFSPKFYDDPWKGWYELAPLHIYDSARRFHKNMFPVLHGEYTYVCVSFHYTKILGLGHGGAILHNNPDARTFFEQMRHDGRMDGMQISNSYGSYDVMHGKFINQWPHLLGHHCPISPEVAAKGLVRLANLPDYNDDLPNSDYPDLSTFEIFK